MTKQFTGWHFTAIITAFFGVVITVNVIMATLAVRTFGGEVVDNGYVASQQYNGWLKAAERQRRLGWKITPSLDARRHVLVSVNVDSASVTGFARHPLGREPDVPLTFDRNLRSDHPLPSGRWAVHLTVRKAREEAQVIDTLS